MNVISYRLRMADADNRLQVAAVAGVAAAAADSIRQRVLCTFVAELVDAELQAATVALCTGSSW